MDLDEYIQRSGKRVQRVCEEIGITRGTLVNIRRNIPVSKEIGEKIRWYTNNQVIVLTTDRHVSYRGKKK